MDTRTFTVRLPEDLDEQVRRESYETRASKNEIVITALRERYARLAAERGQ